MMRHTGGVAFGAISTRSGMAKRVRKTGTGKLMRAKAFKSHILTKKSPKVLFLCALSNETN